MDQAQATPEVPGGNGKTSIVSKVFLDTNILIYATGSARCDLILSEDLNDGQIIRGVKIQNPFTWRESLDNTESGRMM